MEIYIYFLSFSPYTILLQSFVFCHKSETRELASSLYGEFVARLSPSEAGEKNKTAGTGLT